MMFPKKAKLKKINRPEKELQSECEEYLEYIDCWWIHIPQWLNQLLTDFRDKLYRKCIWWKFTPVKEFIEKITGFPDLLILFMDGTYLCVELKTKSKQSQGQVHFEHTVGSQNYTIIQEFEVFKALIDSTVAGLRCDSCVSSEGRHCKLEPGNHCIRRAEDYYAKLEQKKWGNYAL